MHIHLGQPHEVGIWGAVGGKGGIYTRQTGAVTSCLVSSPFCKSSCGQELLGSGNPPSKDSSPALRKWSSKVHPVSTSRCSLSGRSSLLLSTRAPDKTLPAPGIQMTHLPEGFSGRPKGGVPHCSCSHSLRTTLRACGPQSGTAVLGWQQLSCSFQQPEGKGQECLAFAQQSLARGQSFM